MIISSANDYRQVAKRKVPPFMFHYADGGSYSEHTLTRNVSDLSNIALRQRVLNDMSQLNTEIELFGEKLSMPLVLAPVKVHVACTQVVVKFKLQKLLITKVFHLRFNCINLSN